MQLRQMRRALGDQVLAEIHLPVFHDGQRREPTLAHHPSVLAVLAVLSDASVHRWPEREALTRALLREQQRSPGPFWSGVLVLCYMPMLQNLRARLCGDAFERGDYDQLVLTTFLEVVQSLSLEQVTDRTAMHLRQKTERAVFRTIRRAWSENLLLDELTEDPLHVEADPSAFESRLNELRLQPDDGDQLIGVLTERARGVIGEEPLKLVIDTFLRGVSLHDLAARKHPDNPDKRERTYQRLKRGRHRTLMKLRPLLSPPDDPVALP